MGRAFGQTSSEVLNLDLCWEVGQLRWYDPVERRYLHTFDEDRIAALESEVRRLYACRFANPTVPLV